MPISICTSKVWTTFRFFCFNDILSGALKDSHTQELAQTLGEICMPVMSLTDDAIKKQIAV